MKKSVRLLMCGMAMAGTFTSQIAWAGYVPSENAIQSEKTATQRAEINAMLDRSDVQAALQDKGVSADEAKERVAMLSDSQIEQLKTQLDTIPAGEGAIGAIIGAALIVFLVLLFTDIIGETDVYDFDH